MRVKRYTVVSSFGDVELLGRRVDELLKQGWSLHGDFVVVADGGCLFFQPMVLIGP